MEKPEEQSILSAIWILSCNDKIPQMTFKSIKKRLDLKVEIEDVKSLIAKRIELFRLGIPTRQLNEWKEEMKRGKNRPVWVAKESKEKQIELIENISKDDIFRNRFRNSLKSEIVPINIIEWGLNHIDEMYELESSSKEKKINRWTAFWIPLISLLITFFTVVSNSYVSSKRLDIDEYKITFQTKHEGYVEFMKSVTQSFDEAVYKNGKKYFFEAEKMNNAYYRFQPFLSKTEDKEIWDLIMQYQGICGLHINEQISKDSLFDFHIEYKNEFKSKLTEYLILEK